MNSIVYITETDIKKMIKESVLQFLSFLNETRGALDSRMKTLAEMIWDRIEKGETNFVIDTQTINHCQDYFDATKPIVVDVFNQESLKLGDRGKAELTPYEDHYILSINLSYVGKTLLPIPTIMHELTHLVNWERYTIKQFYNVDDPFIKEYYYYFRDTECNARVCEFSYYLDEKIKRGEQLDSNIYCQEYTSIHKLDKMFEIIQRIFYTEIGTRPNYVVQIGRLENFLPNDPNKCLMLFNSAKQKIYNKLRKIMVRYFKKIEKTLKYAIGSQK